MARKALAQDQIVKLIVGAGQASPSPPVGPALGSKGVKSMDFCKASDGSEIRKKTCEPSLTRMATYRSLMPAQHTFKPAPQSPRVLPSVPIVRSPLTSALPLLPGCSCRLQTSSRARTDFVAPLAPATRPSVKCR